MNSDELNDGMRGQALDYVQNHLEKSTSERKEFVPGWVRRITTSPHSVMLNVGCSCIDPLHDMTLEVAHDDCGPSITIFCNMACNFDTFEAESAARMARFHACGGRHGWDPSRWDSIVIWFTKWPGVIRVLYRRLKASLKLLFTGYGEWEGGILMRDQEHINNLLMSLWWALENTKPADNTSTKSIPEDTIDDSPTAHV